MKRKEFIEYLEELRLEAITRMNKIIPTGDADSANYQLGKSVAYRTAIEKLKEKRKAKRANETQASKENLSACNIWPEGG